ncbi:MAG: hypothetical protein QN194_13815 [Armatimonadota bacterium]|nr:hypothetical protein [Armatimonadota bacterium]
MGSRAFAYRWLAAVIAAYVFALLVELVITGARLDAVGWQSPWLSVIAEGFVMGMVVGGWPGVLSAAVPFLLTPETVRWLHGIVLDFRRGERFLGYAAVLYILPLLLAIHVAAVAGAAANRWIRLRRGGGRG